jgi:glucose-1-phosphate adenylyltransferase
VPLFHVLAVILGGGRGTRLYPLTKTRTKPAVPIGGKYRLIDVVMSNCLNSGINRVFILMPFCPECCIMDARLWHRAR